MDERRVFHDSVVPIPVESGPAPHGLMVQPASSEHRDERMILHFSLALPAQVAAGLEEKVARGETVPAEALSGYGAKKADADALTAWLGTQGFEIGNVSADNASIYASAPVATIENSLQVQMVRVSRDGFTYTAARNAPSLPVSVGAAVQAIGGLQPFRQAHKHSRRRPPRNSNRSGLGLAGPGAPEPSPSISNSPTGAAMGTVAGVCEMTSESAVLQFGFGFGFTVRGGIAASSRSLSTAAFRGRRAGAPGRCPAPGPAAIAAELLARTRAELPVLAGLGEREELLAAAWLASLRAPCAARKWDSVGRPARSCGRQAARMYSLIRPLSTGFRRIWRASSSATVTRAGWCWLSGTRWAMPWCGRAAL